MSEFLRKTDLNLLLAFSVLMQERNVTRAAERLHIGQPGLSAALKRLRDTLGDELFVRVGRSLQPTPRALAIAPLIESALASIELVIRRPPIFNSTMWTGTFRVGICDAMEWPFLGPLVAELRRLAPKARLVSLTSTQHDAARQLDDGSYDISIGIHEEPASWHVRVPLFTQKLVCVYDPNQAMFDSPLTLDQFVNIPHVEKAENDRPTAIDLALASLKCSRQIVVTVPHYSALPPALRAARAIALVPEAIAHCMAPLYDLATSKLPINLPSQEISILYRRVDENDSCAAWLRQVCLKVASSSLP
ncbi:LysR family transcriptional regulator [Gluconacetobacter entanii]|uniref:LysR family transcriptional regulator n=1 Tax=Gluconacetobacter entanii TaxID=108528 RepID=UPI001C9362CC|nr:LysR family transcriptional regulator [Gluconacetobacter entanii]MBY4640519.1 LysR family transcriptional regulator [Gluconacetobacter entanii]MCW4579118.1 LysR family transcriptional regulator [Gluconacetobacter entanii]MCW4582509.1 LysR family transcriptional regulator [Gluconacetobacter entanii]MCW4585892.1 LysR family transcriptional regulator [Gluconacetobacter entanii]